MPQDSATGSLLDEPTAEFMQREVSIVASSCGATRVPTLARAIGCRVSPDRRRVTLFLNGPQAAALLADVAATGAIAVVFSRPSTFRTIQLKGSDARLDSPGDGAADEIDAYGESFARNLHSAGYAEAFARTVVAPMPGEIVAVTFTPDVGFVQTPGPAAGAPLDGPQA